VARVILILALCLVVGDATGLLAEGDEVGCTDGDGARCPPTCPTCTCAWHALKTAPTATVELRPIDRTARTVDPPPPAVGHGRITPAPSTRPPIGSRELTIA